MDTLNDYYLDFVNNPNDIDYELKQEIADRPERIQLTFDEWCCWYSDELWNIYQHLREMTEYTSIFDTLDYPAFCSMSYDYSSKYT